jgi:hypothetical protein
MKPTETQETEELALLAELARPVAHECNNFLNNLLLQLAISENDLPESHRADWDRIRQAGKKLGRLLQEWQRQRKCFAEGPMRTAVQPLVQETVDASGAEGESLLFSVRMPVEPMWLACPRAETKRLYSAVLRYATAELRSFGVMQQTLEIQAHKNNGKIIFQVQEAGPGPGSLSWRDFDGNIQKSATDCTLLCSACQSFTERLSGSIRIDYATASRPALQLILPAAD